jgi:ABC-2 type transport system ATP-binding protein
MFVDQARRGVAVLMSIHLLSIAESLADRIGIIHQGKMIATGTLQELREKEAFGGSLEDLFLELTGGDEMPLSDDKNPNVAEEEGLP